MCKGQESSLFNHKMPTSKEEFDDSLYAELCDSHCHPHDDQDNLSKIPQLKTGHITIMGVRQDDWDRVAKVTKDCNKDTTKCIPCFGKNNMIR